MATRREVAASDGGERGRDAGAENGTRASEGRASTPRSPAGPLFDKGTFEQTGTFGGGCGTGGGGAAASPRDSEPMGSARERKFLDDYWSSWQG